MAKILVVDDDEIFYKPFSFYLKKIGGAAWNRTKLPLFLSLSARGVSTISPLEY